MNAYGNQPGTPATSGVPGEDHQRWPELLAPRLFASPARWGWQAAEPTAPVTSPAPVAPRPVWAPAPAPDTGALRAKRSKAVTSLIRRVAFAVVVVAAALIYRFAIVEVLDQLDEQAQLVIWIVLAVIGVVVLLGILRAIGAIGRATAELQRFVQPYKQMQAAQREQHARATRDWEAAAHRHQAEAAQAQRLAEQRASGAQWFPVRPRSQPTRVDVFGGDPRRHGWASLLVTMGSSVLASGERMTVLDLTGQQIGVALARVAEAHGIPASRLDITDGSEAFLLDGVPPHAVAECLAYATTGVVDGSDQRQERALVTDVLRRVVASLDSHPSFGRLAAGIRVLRQGAGDGLLGDDEINRLVRQIGDIDQGEWTGRQLRFLASQLDALHTVAPAVGSVQRLWTGRPVCLINTPGGRDDRKELLDRLLVRVAGVAMETKQLQGFLVVAGADHLGVRALTDLSDHAARTGVRLVLMIDQPQGDVEKTVGTGGAVCIMKMYNHRDATVAAEFVGKGYKFVINQVTQQVGKTLTDGGGDSFAVNTGNSDSTKQGRFRSTTDVSNSRGHAWTGTRNWSLADNIGSSTSSARVHEFVVDPQEILGMPETAFILVDNTHAGRRVALADANPGISLLPRVSPVPAD